MTNSKPGKGLATRTGLTERDVRAPSSNGSAAKMVSVLLALVLAGCGGDPTNAPAYEAIAATVPAPTYTAADTVAAYNVANAVRQNSSAGLLSQSAALDAAAQKHADYLVNNQVVADGAYLSALHEGQLGGHYEDPAKTGFLGKSPQDRASAAGYAGTTTEMVTFGAAGGAECLASLENSVYHLVSLISPFVNIGLGFNAGNGSGSACAVVLGTPSTSLGQLPEAGTVVAYPAAGQTNVAPTFYNQAEAPVPAPDLASAGHPVGVSLYTLAATSLVAGEVVVQSFALAPAGGGPVAARILAPSGVSSSGPVLTNDSLIAGNGFVVLLPVARLNPNTVYTATFSASVRGTTVSKNWSFTTGAMN